MLDYAAAQIVNPAPRPRCDNQGYIGLGQPFPEITSPAPKAGDAGVVLSIDRVILSGRPIGYIYNLKDGHRYFSRRTGAPLTDRQAAALTTFLKRAYFVHHLSKSQIGRLLSPSLNPPFMRVLDPGSAALGAGLAIRHCL
jgi:hypothetical protein